MRHSLIGTAVIFLALVTGACSRSPRVNFYMLEPVAKVDAAATAKVGAAATAKAVPAIVVGPVTLPEVVDRPQLVVRVAANRVEILETHRWAENLKSEIPRVIAENLGRLLGSDRVSSYRQHAGADAQYRVLIDIIRFESVPGEAVTVETLWTIRRATGEISKKGRSLVREETKGPGYDAVAAACSRALLGVSRELALAIQAEDVN